MINNTFYSIHFICNIICSTIPMREQNHILIFFIRASNNIV